jgi:hypothetical protein
MLSTPHLSCLIAFIMHGDRLCPHLFASAASSWGQGYRHSLLPRAATSQHPHTRLLYQDVVGLPKHVVWLMVFAAHVAEVVSGIAVG